MIKFLFCSNKDGGTVKRLAMLIQVSQRQASATPFLDPLLLFKLNLLIYKLNL
jgi:hypothetical protein